MLVDLLRPVLAQLSRDTLNGFVAFGLPGRDAYSSAQGTPRSEPGGIEAGGTDFLIDNVDRFLPLPDAIVRPAAVALVSALHDLPLPLDPGLLGGILGGPSIVTIGLVDSAVRFILENDSATPLSLPVALLLNYVATATDPLSLNGAFLSPFARLSFADKARAMEMLESSQSNLVALLDAQVPQPLKSSVSGLLKFLGGALHEFAASRAWARARSTTRAPARVVLTPVTGEVLRDLFGGFAAATIAMQGEACRIAFAGDDGADDGHPGLAGEVGDRPMDLDVHLVEGLLHPLHAARALRHEVAHLPLQGTEPRDRLARSERPTKEAVAVKQLEPLAVAHVGLAPRNVVQLAGVDEDRLDAS